MKVLLAVKRTVGLIFFFILTAVSEPGCVQLADMDVDLGRGAALRPIIRDNCICGNGRIVVGCSPATAPATHHRLLEMLLVEELGGGGTVFGAGGLLLVGVHHHEVLLEEARPLVPRQADLTRPVLLSDRVHNDIVILDKADVLLVAEQVDAAARPLVDVRVVVVVALFHDHVARVDQPDGPVAVPVIVADARVHRARGEAAARLIVLILCQRPTLRHRRVGVAAAGPGSVRQLAPNVALDEHLLPHQHIELHVAVVLASNVQGVHGDVGVAGRPHTDRRRGATPDDAHHREGEEEEGVSLADRAIGVGDVDLCHIVVDRLGSLFDLGDSTVLEGLQPSHGL